MNFINEIREWWEEYCWQISPERKELAVKRLETYNKFMNREAGFTRNPYTYPEDYNFL